MATTTLTYEQAMHLAPQQEFFSGTPPEIGWWMCKQIYEFGSIVYSVRWWNGKTWSVRVNSREWSDLDLFAEAETDLRFAEIQYCARFWEGK